MQKRLSLREQKLLELCLTSRRSCKRLKALNECFDHEANILASYRYLGHSSLFRDCILHLFNILDQLSSEQLENGDFQATIFLLQSVLFLLFLISLRFLKAR